MGAVKTVRVCVIDRDRCRSKDCGRVCVKYCPRVRSKVDAIKFEEGEDKPFITEALCVGCGICIKKCPFNALSIVNLPDELEEDCSHRFGPNAFKLYRLPTPMPGVVTGLLGKNGTGKTTALKILAGEIRPNLGNYENPPNWQRIIQYYRGSVLQDYFDQLSKGRLVVVHKPQYVDKLPTVVSGRVKDLLQKVDERGVMKDTVKELLLENVLNRTLNVLSGGELQRVAIAAAVCREADVYLFDEPSSYLDVKQRLLAAKIIRGLRSAKKTVIVSEHDLAVLDYLSDQICVVYGEPGVYGIISHAHGVRAGINIYLQGYLPDENVRFRDQPIKFHPHPPVPSWASRQVTLKWEWMEKNYGDFKLEVEPGEIHEGEVIGILGPNGIGKTTFVKLLAGLEKPDKGPPPVWEGLEVGYKPQYISAEYEGTVESLLRSIAKDKFTTSFFKSEILQPLNINRILDREVAELSGGELQRVAIAACLARDVTIYLLDEPSAYLDVEERLSMARTIRRIVESRRATAFVVEHDVVAQDFIADRLMIFTGEPGVRGYAYSAVGLRDGMNNFLKEMGITFRRDATTGRPRVNKEDSRLDKYQKRIGEYYYTSIAGEEEYAQVE
ncbi:MAG: ribosome biogenesis/translation initiation ATPase RLI [Candidatus Bathyarchaeia archaeon]